MMLHRYKTLPATFYLYLAGILLLGVWGLIPSEVETTYTWEGAALLLALIVGLSAGSRFCRRVLVVLGTAVALGSLLLQSDGRLEFVATMWSVLAALTTVLLLTPSMRSFTEGGPESEGGTADVAPSGRPIG